MCVTFSVSNTLTETLVPLHSGRAPPTFEDAAIVAQAVLDSGYEFQKVIFTV